MALQFSTPSHGAYAQRIPSLHVDPVDQRIVRSRSSRGTASTVSIAAITFALGYSLRIGRASQLRRCAKKQKRGGAQPTSPKNGLDCFFDYIF